jgi:hypothetical protein
MLVYKNITLVKSSDGDWEGLYLDNQLYTENHSLRLEDVFEIINDHHISEAVSFEIDCDWLVEDQGGLLPNFLSDIPEGARV